MDKLNEKSLLDTISAVLLVVKKFQEKVLKMITDSEDRFKQLLSEVEFKQGEKGDSPTKEELLNLIVPLIPPSIKGDKPIAGVDYKIPTNGYTPIKGKDYFDGKPGVDGVSPDPRTIALEATTIALETLKPLIPTVETIELDIPKLGEPIRDALELIQEEDSKLKISAIGYLEKRLEELEKKILAKTQILGGGGVGKTNVYYYDLSSQLNGVLKTFSLPAFARILDVKLSSAPVLRPTIDWTSDASALTLTFTSQIDADPLLNSGQSLLILYAI